MSRGCISIVVYSQNEMKGVFYVNLIRGFLVCKSLSIYHYPSACAGLEHSVCLSVVITTNIARSRNLGLRGSCKRNKSVCLESFVTVHKRHKKHCVCWPLWPCPLTVPTCTAHVHNWPGRDCQHYRSISVEKAADARHVRGMCSRML